MRVGIGYDVHRLVENRKLILGGVEVAHSLGLEGHSDADVLVHAIMDALLGAAALGDIGKHFPDTDAAYKGISSMKLLAHVAKLLQQQGYVVENIDATIIAQKPKLRPLLRRWSAILRMYCRLPKSRLMSKQLQRRDLDSAEGRKGFLRRQFVR